MNKLLDSGRFGNPAWENDNNDTFQALSAISLTLGAFIGIFVIAFSFKYNTAEVNASIPIEMTAVEFRQEFDELRRRVEQPYSTGEEYFSVMQRLDYLEVAADKLAAVASSENLVGEPAPKGVAINYTKAEVGNLHRENSMRLRRDWNFDFAAFDAARASYEANRKANPLPQPTVPWELSVNLNFTAQYWATWYALGIVLAFVCFLLYIRQEGDSVLPALVSLDIFGWSLGWVVYLWIRPSKINAAAQLRRMQRSLSYAFSSLLSLFGYAGAVYAQTETPTPPPAKKSSWKVSADTEVNSALIADNGVVFSDKPYASQSVTFERGDCFISAGFSYSVSRKFGQPDGANSISAFAGCTKSVKGVDLSVSGGYLMEDRFSDFKNDYVVVGGKVTFPSKKYKKFEIQTFAAADYYIGTSKATKSGLLVTAGSSFKRELGKNFGVEVTPKVTFDPGAFGNDPAIIAVVNAKLEKRFSNFTWRVIQFRGTIPMTMVRDGRTPAFQWGTGFSY